MDFMSLVKGVLDSPALTGLAINAIGQAYLKLAAQLNSQGPDNKVRMYLHPLMMLLSAVAYVVNGWDKGTLDTDPAHVQQALDYYASTVAIYFGGKAVASKVAEKKEADKPS